ncbi:MAG: hypothetical protein C0467_27965 [Planctomycetaceae bacterium]|nr:hypothetical protein [Planctomycetaceae bacterium]
MSPDKLPSNQASISDFAEAIASAVAERIGKPTPQLLDQSAARVFLGLSRSGWFRAKSADLLPRAVHIEGSGDRWRRKDLDNWIDRQKPTRKQIDKPSRD